MLLCLFIGVDSTVAEAADGNASAASAAEKLRELAEGKVVLPAEGGGSAADDPMLPDAPNALWSDPETRKSYLDALQEYYQYRKAGLQHRGQVFKWQLVSAKIIFVVVLALVAAGIYFAAVQFHSSLPKQGADSGKSEHPVTEISASTEGIKVSSPVLGVIILIISLAFFYLYLVYVYPIEDIF